MAVPSPAEPGELEQPVPAPVAVFLATINPPAALAFAPIGGVALGGSATLDDLADQVVYIGSAGWPTANRGGRGLRGTQHYAGVSRDVWRA